MLARTCRRDKRKNEAQDKAESKESTHDFETSLVRAWETISTPAARAEEEGSYRDLQQKGDQWSQPFEYSSEPLGKRGRGDDDQK